MYFCWWSESRVQSRKSSKNLNPLFGPYRHLATLENIEINE